MIHILSPASLTESAFISDLKEVVGENAVIPNDVFNDVFNKKNFSKVRFKRF